MDKNFNLENDKNIIAEVSGVPVNTTFGSITKPIDLLLEIIDMSADLIALIREETELKKHHRAYLHVHEELEDCADEMAARMQEIFDETTDCVIGLMKDVHETFRVRKQEAAEDDADTVTIAKEDYETMIDDLLTMSEIIQCVADMRTQDVKAIREFGKFVPAFAAFEKNRLSLYREAAKEAEEIFDRWADEIDNLDEDFMEDEDYEPDEYYLHHLYDGTYNKVGCLFADYENKADFSDRNTIIYGHNMRDGSMFAALNEYDEQSYFDTHKQMYLVTPESGYLCEVFAAFVAKPSESGSDTSPWRLSWKDDGAYTTWLTAMAERSVVETDVTVTSSDKVLTLSTCTPGGASRFIVMAKLVEVNN